ncbi:MAG TPA: alpha-amylase family glycosyl hydrolase [Geobacteraceae bacterium]|nr:alpha-amylase family glycosyl hydrolase [Geobacteraceae bacterium]
MGVLMQAFYWDCPRAEQQEFQWWNFVAGKLPELAKAGITALWLPPASKAANIGGMSMGYDVYDYYDLGAYDQKGAVKTWFGSEEELRALIAAAHRHGIKAYADLILNHNNGADAQEPNPIVNQERWTRFTPKSNLFTRDWTCFNPSPYRELDDVTFGDMPDLCHINPRVSTGILNHAKWMIEEVGFDGFRYDFVKGFGAWIVRAIHDRTYTRDGKPVEIFGVGECWAGDTFIDDWLDAVNSWAQHRVGAFDFPLRYRLKDLCDSYGFSLRRLADGGVLMKDRPFEAVTFVDNHDFRGGDTAEVVNDKMLAYAVILTHEGYPCVYWKDWFAYGLAEPGEPGGIERLVRVHESHAGGTTTIVYLDDDLYVMERTGAGSQPGLLFALNNAGEVRRERVRTGTGSRNLVPLAWRAKGAMPAPSPVTTDGDGWCEVEVPPRGYVVYGPAAG